MTQRFYTLWNSASTADDSFMEACFQLYCKPAHPAFYHHPDWLLSSNTHLLDGMLTLCLVFNERDEPVMLLPVTGKSTDRRIRLMAHDHLSLADALVCPSLDETSINSALRTALKTCSENWIDFEALNVPEPSGLVAASRTDSSGWSLRYGRDTAWFDIEGNWRMPGKLRRNLARLRKKLNDTHQVRCEIWCNNTELDNAYEHFLAVENSGWKRTESGTAIAQSPNVSAFYRQLLNRNMPGMETVINILYADDAPIAVQLGLYTKGKLSLLKVGYNESWSQYSPGSLLLEELINELRQRSVEQLSLVTAPAWAKRWHPQTTPVWHMTAYNHGLAAYTSRLAQRTRNALKHHVQRHTN